MKTAVVLGATSGIARALAGELAREGYGLILAGRDLEELEALAADLGVRYGAPARARAFDALDEKSHPAFVEECLEESVREFGGELEGVVLAYGYLGDQKRAEGDFEEARRIVETNFVSCVSVLHPFAAHMEQRGWGWLCVFSSVAGDRGRQSNYMYGAAKGGLSLFLQGLRNRLARSGVRVLTVKPGFVDTAMTFGKEGMMLVASPEAVARGVMKALKKGRDVVYVPGFWRWIMAGVRAVPERVFKKMSL
ncbi:MAG: SDR family oxidoreductase [Kyrpidia tusciae]|nr:SDR family oxidoreductase [Kyrpidia tusciae]MBE3552814.1 SDR family oxidoreductase [Kyrpidia tusciae]